MLAHALVTADGGGTEPTRWITFLHGILGTGNNLRTIAKAVVAARPTWGAALVDLRLHGQSLEAAPPDDLASAARDLVELERALPGPIAAVFGHSFGGKVALAYLRERAVDHAFIVDSTPSARPDGRGSEGTLRIVNLLQSLPERFETRDEFVRLVMADGHSKEIATWLALNVRPRREGGYAFALDVPRIANMLGGYFTTDLWDAVERGPTQIELVVGGKSTVLDPADRERAKSVAAASEGRVHVHVVENAGHWVHVDAPAELVRIVTEALPR